LKVKVSGSFSDDCKAKISKNMVLDVPQYKIN